MIIICEQGRLRGGEKYHLQNDRAYDTKTARHQQFNNDRNYKRKTLSLQVLAQGLRSNLTIKVANAGKENIASGQMSSKVDVIRGRP